jgi:hypothetical protein
VVVGGVVVGGVFGGDVVVFGMENSIRARQNVTFAGATKALPLYRLRSVARPRFTSRIWVPRNS